MQKVCKFCGSQKELRFGSCFDCAEAESIIEEGLDMYDVGFGGRPGEKAQTSGQKLKMLIEKGWVLLSNIEKQQLNKKI